MSSYIEEGIPCVVELRRNADGVVRIDRSFTWHGDYIWADGNFACDCNRYLFFQRAGGEPEDDEEHECSDDKYAVRITDEAGKPLYQDEAW